MDLNYYEIIINNIIVISQEYITNKLWNLDLDHWEPNLLLSPCAPPSVGHVPTRHHFAAGVGVGGERE